MINEQLLNPRSIVVIGGSNNVHKPGGSIVPCYLKSPNICDELLVLEKNNIRYDQYDGERLADFLNGANDYKKWWESKQDIVEGFMKKVAGDYAHMKDIWVNEIVK